MTTTANQAHRALSQRRATEAALNNEMVTRQRVDVLERMAKDQEANLDAICEAVEIAEGIMQRDLLGRLRWLFTGK